MMGEDVVAKLLKGLKIDNERRKENYTLFMDILQKLRSKSVSAQEKETLILLELIFDDAKDIGDSISETHKAIADLLERIEALEKEVIQLRHSLDTLDQNR